MPRYVLIHPVPNGDRFWTIEDKQRNVAVAWLRDDAPNAQQEAEGLCARMNAGG